MQGLAEPERESPTDTEVPGASGLVLLAWAGGPAGHRVENGPGTGQPQSARQAPPGLPSPPSLCPWEAAGAPAHPAAMASLPRNRLLVTFLGSSSGRGAWCRRQVQANPPDGPPQSQRSRGARA